MCACVYFWEKLGLEFADLNFVLMQYIQYIIDQGVAVFFRWPTLFELVIGESFAMKSYLQSISFLPLSPLDGFLGASRRRRGEWGNENKILIERGDIDSAHIAYVHTSTPLSPLPKCIWSRIPEGDAAASIGTKFIFVNSTIVCRVFF